MSRVVGFIYFSLVLLSMDLAYANEPQFRRDLLQSAFSNWVSTVNASHDGLVSQSVSIYGSTEVHQFNTKNGSAQLRVHLDANHKAYDLGIALPSQLEVFSTEVQTIAERFLWAFQLSDIRLQRTFFNASNIKVDFGVIGGLDEQLNAFQSAVKQRNLREDVFLEHFDEVYTIRTTLENSELRIDFKPDLNLVLNGQVDVVTDYIRSFLNESTSQINESKVNLNPIHQVQISDKEIRFTALSQKMTPFTVNFSITDTYETKPTFSDLPKLREYRNKHWSSWPFWKHIPGYIDQLQPADVRLILEGVDVYELEHVEPDRIADLAAYLSEGMVVLSDTEEFSHRSDGNYVLTTYVVFHDPDLSYQHMARIRETFSEIDHAYKLQYTEIHVLLTVRLDNIKNLYSQHFGSPTADPVILEIRQY
jgi:hypothetical protein